MDTVQLIAMDFAKRCLGEANFCQFPANSQWSEWWDN